MTGCWGFELRSVRMCSKLSYSLGLTSCFKNSYFLNESVSISSLKTVLNHLAVQGVSKMFCWLSNKIVHYYLNF